MSEDLSPLAVLTEYNALLLEAERAVVRFNRQLQGLGDRHDLRAVELVKALKELRDRMAELTVDLVELRSILVGV